MFTNAEFNNSDTKLMDETFSAGAELQLTGIEINNIKKHGFISHVTDAEGNGIKHKF